MEQEKNNKGVIALFVVLVIILAVLCVLFATGTISFKNKIDGDNQTAENNDGITNNLKVIIDDNHNNAEYTYTKNVITQNGNETLFANQKEIKLGNKQILKLEDGPQYVRQVSVYNDVVITLQTESLSSSIVIYDLLGNTIKTIGLFSDEQGRMFRTYPSYSQDESFNLSNDGIISFAGTKHIQGGANTYIDNSGNTIDLCTQGENIDDSEIVAGIFKISYLGNNSFSDIAYVSTKTIVKDIKSCN